MTPVKERLIGAVTVMDDETANRLWDIVISGMTPEAWENIEAVEPDEWDRDMLKAIKNDSDCHEFTKEHDINWDEKE